MRCFALVTALWACLGLAAAVLVIGLGLYNVSALRGHFPGVAWIMHATYKNSVKLRAPPQSAVPELTGDLAMLGARHYDSACRFCHAAPGERQSETAMRMEPRPPHIEDAVKPWEPRHLFWIVRNGVKMTGMPAWPSTIRDDDVWAVVAFLVRAQGMDAATYRSLAGRPEAGPFENVAAYCESCHVPAREGGGNGHIPRLDIQGEDYLRASLRAYREGVRHSGVMQHAASGLSDAAIGRLARHFASLPLAPETAGRRDGAAASPSAEQGRKLAASTDPASDTPACSACHGPWPARRFAGFPELAGQQAGYLYTQLKLWKAGRRGGTGVAHLMHKVVPELDDEQMRALADYYGSLPPRKSDHAIPTAK